MERLKKDVTSFWQLHISLAQYSPDTAVKSPIKFDKYNREISLEEYLDDIYVRRDNGMFESNIAHEIQKSSRILCIAGERGSGKTSAVEWVRRHLTKERSDIRFEKIDIKKIYDIFRFPSLKNETDINIALKMESTFKKCLLDCLRQNLFPDPLSYKRFVAWSLAGSPDQSELFDKDIISDLYLLSLQILNILKCESEIRKLKEENIYNYFVINPNKYKLYLSEIEKILRIPHIIQGYLCLNKNQKQVILALDNVDRIPSELQPYFISICRDFQLQCGAISSCAISIRIENTRGKYPLPGDENFIDLILPDNNKYDAILLPSLDDELTNEILERRTKFSHKIIKESKNKASTENQNNHEELILPYIESIGKELVTNNVHKLSNGSCRVFLNVYVGFMRYIWTSTDLNLIDQKIINNIQEKHLQTLLFLYLSIHKLKEEINIQNILVLDLHPEADTFAKAISPRYLLLTCIYNLKKYYNDMGMRNVYPSWNEVVQRMESLGYSYFFLIKLIKDFFAPVGQPASILRFQNRELNIQTIQEDSLEPIMLTEQGEEILLKVLEKAGFIFGLAIKQHNIGKSKSYYDFTPRDRARYVYKFMKDIAKYHLNALLLLKKEWSHSYGKDWISNYRNYFGIDRKLQCERILDSSAKFFSHLFGNKIVGENPFSKMCKNYSLLIDKILTCDKLDEDDYLTLDEGDSLIKK